MWRLLALAMPLTIAGVALLGWWVLGLAPASALLLGAVLAPTDPVLASDVQVLRDEFGYDLARCRPFDMFPHTPHVESVSLLKQRPSTE